MFARDLRFAARLYRRTPVFSGIATLVLAVTIAVATAVFSLYSHLALQPVEGVRGADRLVSIGLARDTSEWIPFSREQYTLMADALTVPETLVATSVPFVRNVEMDGVPSEAATAGVSRNFFSDLGIAIALGTDLASASGDPEATNAVVSERFWREQLGARPAAVGSTIRIEDRPFTIVGVAGGRFEGLRRGQRDEIWIPLDAALNLHAPAVSGSAGLPAVEADAIARRMRSTLPLVRLTARLPPGIGIGRLRTELDLISPRLREDGAAAPRGIAIPLVRAEAVPGTFNDPRRHEVLVRQSRLLVGGAVLVLLVASLNLASFMLARGPGRIGELRTRLAIGASAGAVVRQLFVEAVLLITAAAVLGLLLHYWLRGLLLQIPPFSDAPAGWLAPRADWRVALFVVGVGLGVSLIAGLVPAVRIASRPTLSAGVRGTPARRGNGLKGLLVLQVAVATLVVLAGMLFLGEVRRLETAPLGFDPTSVAAGMALMPEASGGGIFRTQTTRDQMEQLAFAMQERVTALPGVEGFAVASAVPFHSPPTNPTLVELPGAEPQLPEDRRRVYQNRITPEFFRILGVGFVHGRSFDPLDPQQIVISRALAERLWGREDVVGERLALADTDVTIVAQGNFLVTRRQGPGDDAAPQLFTVVGVVDDLRYGGADSEYPPMLYRASSGSLAGQRYVVRGSVDGAVLHAILDEIVRERLPSMTAEAPVSLRASMYDALRDERARSRLALGAAAIALLLTLAGLYASMRHAVDARRSELAVRKAVGATDGRLVAMILGQALAVVAAGGGAALVAAIVFAERLQGVLLGLDALSPAAWCAALALIAVTGLGAACRPALRAGRVDPANALRYE